MRERTDMNTIQPSSEKNLRSNANEVESCKAHELAKYFIALFSSL